MASRETFSRYVYELHETVNKMLHKKSKLTYCDVRERYEHFRSRCTEEKPKIFTFKKSEERKKEQNVNTVLSKPDLLKIFSYSEKVYVDPKLNEYIVKLVRNTRPASTVIQDVKPFIRHGASPRASLALLKACRAQALLEGRNFVIPEDITFSLFEVLRHRVMLTFEALSEDVSIESILDTIREGTRLP
jgi:MoxR-like ATPase